MTLTPERPLDLVLKSKAFQQVQLLKDFVGFVVLETKDGRGDQPKGFVVGVQVLDKESSFDPRNDAIVRVRARRLRMRLATYYFGGTPKRSHRTSSFRGGRLAISERVRRLTAGPGQRQGMALVRRSRSIEKSGKGERRK